MAAKIKAMKDLFSPRKTRSKKRTINPPKQSDGSKFKDDRSLIDDSHSESSLSLSSHVEPTLEQLDAMSSMIISDSHEPTSSDARLRNIESLLGNLVPTIVSIKADVSEIKEHQSPIDLIDQKVDSMKSELDQVIASNKHLADQNRILKDRVIRLESYSRRNNLIFYNVPEDTAPVINTIRRILKEMGLNDTDNMLIDDAHRLGGLATRPTLNPAYKPRPRPIIFRLVMKTDRHRIWSARFKLAKSKISLREDYPEEYERERNLLRPVLSVAIAKGSKATLVANKLKVDGKLYSADQINDLPHDLDPEKGCIVENRATVCFFGRYTPLSNFSKCEITVLGRHFNCIEQYLQYRKAEILKSDVIAQRILKLNDPVDQKRMTNSLKDPQREWAKVAESEVKTALVAKFTQHPAMKEYLIATGKKTLGEASLDPNWGIGMTLKNPNIMDINKWTGKNWLGNLLMKVRTELTQ